MKTVVRSVLLTVTLWVLLEQAASNPDPQFQFGPFVFHPVKSKPRYDIIYIKFKLISIKNITFQNLTLSFSSPTTPIQAKTKERRSFK